MPEVCTDAQGVDREDIHRSLISEAGRFFNQTLKSVFNTRTVYNGQ